MSDRESKVSGKRERPTGAESATRTKLPASAAPKTSRMKRPPGAPGTGKTGKVTQKGKPVRKEEVQELEAITPFSRGVSIGVKFAAFTAAVVGMFMGLQGYLTFSITAREMDEQIRDQGVQIVSTLEKAVDRGLWIQPQDRDTDRDYLIAQWEERLEDLVKGNPKIVSVNLLEDNQAFVIYPPIPPSHGKEPIAIAPPDVKIYEGAFQNKRVRRFDKPIHLDLQRDDQIDAKIRELEMVDPEDTEKAEPILAALRTLTGAKGLRSLEEVNRWREEHPRPVVIGGRSPSVSVYVDSSRLDELKNALWTRIAIVTGCGAVAGILLTVLIATLLTAPVRQLEQDLKLVAQGDLTHQTPVMSRDEIGALAHVFNIMIRNLGIAQNNAVERKSFERELTICKEIQEKLLPERIPQIPGYDIQSHYRSAKEVGGDYYDFIVIDQTHLGIIVADVAGKGVPGAMVMTMARSLVRLASVRNVSPADTFKKVNRILAKDIRRGMFVTAAYMVLNVKTRKLRVASAGHNPVVLYRAASSEIELLKPAGIALGFDKGTIFDNHVKEVEVQLETGDRIVTYTDGVNEAMNHESEEFGDERFHDLVKAHGKKSSKDFVEALVKALDAHRGDAEQSDDITITTLAVVEGGGGASVQEQEEADGGEQA